MSWILPIFKEILKFIK